MNARDQYPRFKQIGGKRYELHGTRATKREAEVYSTYVKKEYKSVRIINDPGAPSMKYGVYANGAF